MRAGERVEGTVGAAGGNFRDRRDTRILIKEIRVWLKVPEDFCHNRDSGGNVDSRPDRGNSDGCEAEIEEVHAVD